MTNPSAASLDNASRSGLRLTPNWPRSSSRCSFSPGGMSPFAISVRRRVAMPVASVRLSASSSVRGFIANLCIDIDYRVALRSKSIISRRRFMHAIDVHAHWYPKRFLELVSRHGAEHGIEWREVEGKPQFKHGLLVTGPLGPNFIDLDARLAAMDAQGVHVHALSLSQPMNYWAGRSLGEKLAAVFNEDLALAHEKTPKRLVGLAALPMHEPDLAVKEVDRAAKL